jgi:hypothetical protein
MLGTYLQRGLPNRICKYIRCDMVNGKKVITFIKRIKIKELK